MNIYAFYRDFWDFAFENPEKIKPGHVAVYCFAIEHRNRLGWKEKFGFPSQMAMDAIGIKKHETYIQFFNDLVDWGFFKLIEKSKNQYSANIISLGKAPVKNEKSLDSAIIKKSSKDTNCPTRKGESTGESIGESTGESICLLYTSDAADE